VDVDGWHHITDADPWDSGDCPEIDASRKMCVY
jgi:hypothetical protein